MDIYSKKPVEYWRHFQMRATVVLSHEDSNAIAATEEYGGILLAALRKQAGIHGTASGRGKKLKQFIRSIIIAPPRNILFTSYWTHSAFGEMDTGNTFSKTILNNYNQDSVEMSYADLFLYTSSIPSNEHIYAANMHERDLYYYNLSQSVNVIEKLLLEQCQWSTDVYSIVDNKKQRLNTLLIVSPPAAGKNFFLDAVVHSCISFGQIGNFNKHTSFNMQEAVQKRIILWNEPNYEPEKEEESKLLLGGDSMNIKVKHMADANLRRTPIIVL